MVDRWPDSLNDAFCVHGQCEVCLKDAKLACTVRPPLPPYLVCFECFDAGIAPYEHFIAFMAQHGIYSRAGLKEHLRPTLDLSLEKRGKTELDAIADIRRLATIDDQNVTH